MTHDEIVAECLRRDAMKGLTVHFITAARGTCKLIVQSMYWSSLDMAERYCMVQFGNIFDSVDDAHAAIDRALTKPQ